MTNSIDALHVLQEVVRPALASLGPTYATVSAEQLVIGTAALESGFVRLRERGHGSSSRGLWSIEPESFYGLINRCSPSLLASVLRMSTVKTVAHINVNEVCWNLRLGAVMCRLKYLDDQYSLPVAGDVYGMESSHKRCYDAGIGKRSPGEFTSAWCALIAPRYQEMWPS